MIHYSIFNIALADINQNITVRIEELEFKDSVITFDPIKLVDKDTISYSLDIKQLKLDGEYVDGKSLEHALGEAKANKFVEMTRIIFIDLLELFKGDIKYDK